MAARITSSELIGRTAALERLLVLPTAMSDGRSRHLVVVGEAGVGKSRLLARAAELVQHGGARVLSGGCVSVGDATLPFAPYAEALRDLMAQDGRDRVAALAGWGARDLGRLVPALVPDDPTETSDPANQLRLFEAIHDLLRRLSAEAPVVVQLEDMHWADAGTLAATNFLFRSIRAEPVSLVCSVRADDIAGQRELREWLAEASRSGRVERLDLEPLTLDETRELVSNISGGELPAAIVDDIHARSDGNPYFIEELLASGAAVGRYLPPSLREVLLARVDQLDRHAQRLLAVAAVCGREVDHEVLVAVDGREPETIADDLDRLVGAGLLTTVVGPGRDGYAFRHALLQEAVLASVIPPERRRVHGEVAAVLEARGDADSGDVRLLLGLAHHLRESRSEHALAATIRAGDAAMEAYAFATGGAEYDRALELWQDDMTSRAGGVDRTDLLIRSARAASNAGDYRHAVALAEEGLDGVDDPHRRTELGLICARALWNSGEWSRAIEVFEQALEAAPPPPDAARIKALAGLGQGYMLLGWLARAKGHCEAAIALAQEAGARDLEGHALNTLAICLAGLGQTDAALAAIDTALAIAEELEIPDDIGRALVNKTDVLNWAGRTREALEVSLDGRAVTARLGIDAAYLHLRYNGVLHGYLVGEWEAAAELLAEADRLADRDIGVEAYRAEYALNLLVSSGAPEAAATWERARQMRARHPRAATSTSPFTAAVELRCYEGRFEEAVEIGEECLDLLRQIDGHWRVHEVVRALAWPLVEVGRATRVTAADEQADAAQERFDRLIAIVAEAREQYSPPPGPALELLAAHDAHVEAERLRLDGTDRADGWAGVATRWRDVERPLFEAYAWWRASGASDVATQPTVAQESLRCAYAIAQRLGAMPLLGLLETSARRLRIRLGTDGTPERPAGTASPYGLTAREQEVLRLVAVGQTNAQIGETLFISPSTAGVHVSNILSKMGVSTRTEAASVAVRDGLASA